MSEPGPEEKIDATFRNGSLTAAGIILGFSLNFISRWVSNPNDWSRIDILPMLFLTVGIALQVKVFADLLARDSLIAAKYDRSRRLFLIGLGIVAAGMGSRSSTIFWGLARCGCSGDGSADRVTPAPQTHPAPVSVPPGRNRSSACCPRSR